MKKANSAGFVVLVVILLAASFVMTESDGPGQNLDLWKDEAFQRQFMGSFGVNADIEPQVSTIERAALQEIIPLLSADDQTEAISRLEEAITPDSSAVFDFTLANIFFQRDETAHAAELYRGALMKFPSFRRAHKNLGLIQVRNGDYEDALSSLSKVIELGGGDGMTYGLLGYSYSMVSEFVSAESAYRSAILLAPETLDWKVGLTHSVMKQRKYGEAVTLCEELITRYPERTEFWLMQANAFIGMDQALKAAENYEIIRRMGKATSESERTLGDIYVNARLWALAGEAYSRAYRLDKDADLATPLRWVEVLAQRGAIDEAMRLLSEVKEARNGEFDEKDEARLLKVEARIAAARGDDSEEVIKILERIVELDPLDGDALILLGQHYGRTQQYEKAIFVFERASRLDDHESNALVRHAEVLVAQSKFAEAIPLLKRAQNLDSRDDVARYLEQVEKVARRQR